MTKAPRPLTLLVSTILFTTTVSAQVPTWTDVTPVAAIPDGNTAVGTDVAFGNGIFVATVSTSMVTGKVSVFTSPDGATWTRREVGDGGIGGVAVVDVTFTGDRFVLATGERVFTSLDGITWDSVTHIGAYPHYVAHGAGATVLVANNLNGIMSSTDFTTWTPRTNPNPAAYSFLGVNFGAGQFFAFGNAGGPVLASPDGITWTDRPELAVAGGSRLVYGNGVWLSTNQNDFRVSYDGGATFVTYSNATALIASEGVRFAGGRFIVRSLSTTMKASVDGSTWAAFGTLPNNNFAAAVAAGNGKYVAVGSYFGVASKNLRISVADAPTGVPSITTHPANTVVYTGQPLRLGAAVLGEGLSYQWMRNDTPVAGAIHPAHYVSSATLADAGTYTLRVTNADGTATSNPARVTVYPAGSIFDGLVAYYPFEDAAGTDRSGFGRDLSAFGTIAVANGQVGEAAELQPVVTTPLALAGFQRNPGSGFDHTAITLALWARPEGPGRGNPPLAGLRSLVGTHFYALLLNGTSAPRAAGGISGGSAQQNTTATLADNAWTHLAVTVSGTTMKLYVNGTLDRTVTSTAITLNPTFLERFFVGAIDTGSAANSTAFDGVLDELWVFNRALGDTEIAQLHADDGSLIPLSGAPLVTTQPEPQTLTSGGGLSLTVASNDPAATLQWYHNDAAIPGATGLSYTLPSAQRWHAGTYFARFTNTEGTRDSDAVAVTINAPAANNARLLNLSTRAQSLTGDNILIPGFVVSGTGTKQLLIRAVGPTLANAPYNIASALTNPRMALKRLDFSVNPPVYVDIDANDDWQTNANAAAITQAIADLFAFPFEDDREAALLVDLIPGQYTVFADGVNDATGIAIVELYDADTGAPTSRLINISNRGFVGTGDSVMIPGFVVSSEGPKTLLIRVVGPTLAGAPYNVPGTMTDPKLEIFPAGSNTPILANDNWGDNPDAATTAQTAIAVSAFALAAGSADAAFVVTLPPGTYTVVGSSADGTGTGVVLVEVYVVP